MIRLAFFGTPAIAVPALERLREADDIAVVAVVTKPDRPRGRSGTPQPPPVKEAVADADLEILQPPRPAAVVDALEDLALDVAAVVGYGAILPAEVLATTAHGFVNLHFSLLPRWRGAAPVQHAIRAGDEVTGVTTFVLDEGMDTGPILDRIEVEIGPDETAGELLDRLAEVGAPLLVDSIRRLVSGEAEPTPQDDEEATLAPRIDRDDVRIDWSEPGRRVVDLVRSANPRPGAYTTRDGSLLKVWRAERADGEGAPGTILSAERNGPVVATGGGAVRLLEVQPAGRQRMDGRSYLNGYQPEPGTRLGT